MGSPVVRSTGRARSATREEKVEEAIDDSRERDENVGGVSSLCSDERARYTGLAAAARSRSGYYECSSRAFLKPLGQNLQTRVER